MQHISRRQALGYSALALSPLIASSAVGAVQPKPIKAEATPTNPLAARAAVYTVVTPDLDGSIRFYCDLMGYDLAKTGALQGRMPTVAGVGEPGRRYALLHAQGASNMAPGALRLLEVAEGAPPNRPRPTSNLLNPGLGTFQLMTRDDAESYKKLSEGGAKTITPPQFYYHYNMRPRPGVTGRAARDIEVRSYSVYGPSGEQMFITYGVSVDHKPWPASLAPQTLHSAFGGCSIMCLDRWPVWDFYDQAFGIKPTRDTDASLEAVNSLTGMPEGTYFRFGILGEGLGIEYWEFRQPRPPGIVYPTALDRTGLAMFTLLVDDLEHVRANIKAAGIVPVGAGALPTLTAEYQDGLYLRGAVGELIEVIGRNSRRG